MNNLLYNKRSGTSGVSGQLYETKLLSLILFRALHDDDIEEFHLGTNVDELGEFDDICLRFRVKGSDKPVAIFLQAKHRDDKNRPLVVTRTDLMRYFSSYLKIKNKFSANSSDVFFKGAYDDVECAFVFYTNTRDELNKEYTENCYMSKINEIISTGDDAFQLPYTDDDVELLNKMMLYNTIGKLATLIANIVRDKGDNYGLLMNDELIQTYHVILSKHVFIVTDTQLPSNADYRIGSFNCTFLNSISEHLELLRIKLVCEALKYENLIDKESFNSSSPLSFESSIHTISKSIGSDITYNNKTFEFVDVKMNDHAHLKEQLEKVNVAQTEFYSGTFKLPTAFDNQDMTLQGNDKRKEKRLCHLANIIVNLLKESQINEVNGETLNIVYIDDDFSDKGFLRLNGGIAGAVGNLLVLDERTQLLMFENGNSLRGHAKTLFNKINSEIKELDKYRFDVKVRNFPKLSFDRNEHDKSMVADFTKKILICTNQASESEVEHILKEDIARLQYDTERSDFQMKSDAIFLSYHDEIQKWWMKQENAKFLTKSCRLFKNTIEHFISNPLLSVANVLHKNRSIKYDVKFDTEVISSLKLDEAFTKITIMVSDVIALSVIKVTQYINNDSYICLDLNYLLKLPIKDCYRLNKELTDVKDKIFILTYKLSDFIRLKKDIKNILQTLKTKKLIVVTTNESVAEIKKYLAHTEFFIVDDKNSLVDLTRESQEIIIRNTDVIFQGVHAGLSLLLDDDSRAFIKGELMEKVMNGDIVQIGEPLTNSRYEEIKDLYVDRKVTTRRVPTGYYPSARTFYRHLYVKINLNTFHDLDDHAVLLTAEPGMGKSSLLTHLSLTTKARDPAVWIVRMELLDYSRFFHQWKVNKTVIDILEALRFICIALVNQKESEKIILKDEHGEIFLEDCCPIVDKGIIFEISMFLHSCNRHKVIFVFDGFDEICPHYEPQILQLLKALKHYRPRAHRIWITSRTYSTVLRSLQQEFGEAKPLHPFDPVEQQAFIKKFLKLKLDLNELNHNQIEKINDFITFMAQSHSWEDEFSSLFKCRSIPLHQVYLIAAQYFKDEIKHVLFMEDKEKYLRAWYLNVRAMKSMHLSCNGKRYDIKDMLEFIATPLHVYMVADYFQNEIKHVKTDTIWDLNFHTYTMYEHFVETKFKKIRFEEKNQMDLYRPDVLATFERERKHFINEHKKLAAYAMFFEDVDKLFSETQLEEIRDTVKTINLGREKTGIIHAVIDGVPRFVHLSFAEYFAVEYICDRLKADQSDDDLKSLWDFILNIVFFKNSVGVLNILDDKLIMEEKLKNKVSDARSRKTIFDLLMQQSAGKMELIDNHDTDDANTKIKIYSSLHKAMSENLRNLLSLFLTTFEFLTKDNIDDIIKIILDTGLLLHAVIIKNVELTNVILETVNKIDSSKLAVLFNQIRTCHMTSLKCEGNITDEQIIGANAYIRDMLHKSEIFARLWSQTRSTFCCKCYNNLNINPPPPPPPPPPPSMNLDSINTF